MAFEGLERVGEALGRVALEPGLVAVEPGRVAVEPGWVAVAPEPVAEGLGRPEASSVGLGRLGGAVRVPDRFGGSGVGRVGTCRDRPAGADDATSADGCALARNATPTTTRVAADMTNLIPRLTHVLLSP
ncbi:hypothetical protein [Kribbella sp. NBC_00359]|uniref:hypothetical protein n=1 Tax=Kribbella sp. NBC_00359 TaxID=2975966 RepID=UPI002E1D5B9B